MVWSIWPFPDRLRLATGLSGPERMLHEGLFHELASAEFRRLLRSGLWRHLPEGAVLTRQGEPVSELMIIAEGSARVIVGRVFMGLLRPGYFVGETSFIGGKEATATVIADSPMRLFVVARPGFERLLRRDRGIEIAMLRAVNRELAAKLASLHSERAAATLDASSTIVELRRSVPALDRMARTAPATLDARFACKGTSQARLARLQGLWRQGAPSRQGCQSRMDRSA